MTKRLTYFNVNGLAEPIRYIFHYTGQKFEDVRLDSKAWTQEYKDTLPFGQIPILEENGRVLHQSIAITKYAAANTDLIPSDPWQQAVLDAAVLTFQDYDKHCMDYVREKDPVKKQEIKKKIYEEHLDFYFSRFEKQLKENNGHFGEKLSWADFVFVGIVECSNRCYEDRIDKNYPHVTALIEEIRNLPGVKEYIRDKEPFSGYL